MHLIVIDVPAVPYISPLTTPFFVYCASEAIVLELVAHKVHKKHGIYYDNQLLQLQY